MTDSRGQARRELYIFAFHFPPTRQSSGMHRTLAFAKHLPQYGWKPTVFTVGKRAYPEIDEQNLALIPPGLNVVRSPVLDTQRHLSVRGRYPLCLAVPDRWQSWAVTGTVAGLHHARRAPPRVLFSTFPIATAHVIARYLHRRFDIPWVADLRDPMVFETVPSEGKVRTAYMKIEESIFNEAERVIVTTEGAAEMYRDRYPQLAQDRLRVIENGVEEEVFQGLSFDERKPRGALTILHSGIIYSDSRNPRGLFAALAALKSANRIPARGLSVIFRASLNDPLLRGLTEEYGIQDIVQLRPSVTYRDALEEMINVDGLLLLQAKNCNNQIPAKAYEYLYTRRPILALTDPAGETGRLLKRHGVSPPCALEDHGRIESALCAFLEVIENASASVEKTDQIHGLSRRERTRELAAVLDEI